MKSNEAAEGMCAYEILDLVAGHEEDLAEVSQLRHDGTPHIETISLAPKEYFVRCGRIGCNVQFPLRDVNENRAHRDEVALVPLFKDESSVVSPCVKDEPENKPEDLPPAS